VSIKAADYFYFSLEHADSVAQFEFRGEQLPSPAGPASDRPLDKARVR